jgi:polysaccharide biosynthesis protein PslE
MAMRTVPANQTFEESVTDALEDRPGMSLRNLAHIVYRRKWLVLVVFLCSAAAATAITLRTLGKPVFLATSQILVSPSREQVVDPTSKAGGAVAPWEGFNAVEQTAWVREILTGRFLAERVVKTIGTTVLYPQETQEKWEWWSTILRFLGVDEAPISAPVDQRVVLGEAVDAFLENVSADPVGRSSIISISFKHHDPQIAAKVVNLLGEMYLERHLGVQKNPKSDTFFREQFQVLKRELSEAEEAVLAFKQRNGITSSVKQEQELVLKQQSDLRRELTEVKSRQAEVQSRDAELRRQLANTTRTPSIVGQLRQKLTALEIQEGELALRFTAQNPALRGVRDEIQKLQARISDIESANLYGSESSQDSLYAILQTQLLSNVAEGRALRAREETHTAKFAELQARLNSLEQLQTDFNHLEKQLQMDENRLYLTKFEESRISGAMDQEKIASVRVIEQAQAPSKPLSSKRKRKVLLCILLSAIGAMGLPFVLQFLSRSLDTAEDVERSLGLPVLASIPRLGVK